MKAYLLDRSIFEICNLGVYWISNGACIYARARGYVSDINLPALSPLLSYIRNTCVSLYRVPCLWQGRFRIYFARAKHLSQPQKVKSRRRVGRQIVRFRFFSSVYFFY